MNDPISDNINDSVLKEIAKCKNHPSIKAIEKIPEPVDKEDVIKMIKMKMIKMIM